MWQTRWGKCIYVSDSGFEVHQNLFYRWLTLGKGPLQTLIHRRKPHCKMLNYLPMLTVMACQDPGDTCLLGLGGGSVLHLLPNISRKSLYAVEIDGEVIKIAQRFFYINEIEGLEIFEQNALDFLNENTEQFKHLLIDLYDRDSFPKDCQNKEFFQLCKQHLTTNGFLAINLANSNEQLAILELTRTSFINTLSVAIPGCQNVVVIASNCAKDEFIERMRQTKLFRKLYWMEQWGNVGIG